MRLLKQLLLVVSMHGNPNAPSFNGRLPTRWANKPGLLFYFLKNPNILRSDIWRSTTDRNELVEGQLLAFELINHLK